MARKLKNTSASSFLRAAWGHAKAARILDPHTGLSEGRTNATFFAFHNVLGFAIELYLKAFLAGRGWTVEKLANSEFAHKLDALLKASVEAGLFDQIGFPHVHQSALARVVAIIGPRFADYSYRYIDDDNNQYEYVETSEYLWPILDDLQLRIENSGVRVESAA
ncbi:hypothetical protein EOA79_19615 [Mesorhizobium sp. M1A.F.Ca.IN.020.03.2.1]|uniref:hypothetical protein n=1 Tax=Mesorhizobium sp. M1A.F.Ca.IN.020.03.2.1 TaxID=2496769 RepID=UPI000FD29F09|nr:hypothetical protein [Mesorhizobium sp. M1A.F.Ca.IN.020.03.2.1]RUV01003.1 hypothetical protein EOA79_19615 [Mesorhizobium sp. M1A.F.Ca.IN.020.03.2.1]